MRYSDRPPTYPRFDFSREQWELAIERGSETLRGIATRRTTITYVEFAWEIEVRTGLVFPAGSYALSELLEDISTRSAAEHSVALTALVVSQLTGLPGPGFDEMCSKLNVISSREPVWQAFALPRRFPGYQPPKGTS